MNKIKIKIKKLLHGSSKEMLLDIDLEIKKGSFVALTGESGSGKTTLLRILSGLEEAEGEIIVDNTIWQDKEHFLPPQKRKIGFVFQDYALFLNMSVQDNLLFVKKDKELATQLLKLTNLYELRDRYPNSLSGGQKQRVSLCRAIMNQPQLLLMDEPLSALDIDMRKKLQNEILLLHKKFNMTTIMVSHDPSEIYHLSSRVIVLKNGKVIDDDTPKKIFFKDTNSNRLSFEGEILDILEVDTIFVVIISVGHQLREIVVDKERAKNLKIGNRITISVNSFGIFL
jgi:molybdate transport system ATP-binding protein